MWHPYQQDSNWTARLPNDHHLLFIISDRVSQAMWIFSSLQETKCETVQFQCIVKPLLPIRVKTNKTPVAPFCYQSLKWVGTATVLVGKIRRQMTGRTEVWKQLDFFSRIVRHHHYRWVSSTAHNSQKWMTKLKLLRLLLRFWGRQEKYGTIIPKKSMHPSNSVPKSTMG